VYTDRRRQIEYLLERPKNRRGEERGEELASKKRSERGPFFSS
jgi:hypothetical protein